MFERAAPSPQASARPVATWRHRMFTGASGSRVDRAGTLRSGDDSGAGPACSRVTARSPGTTSAVVRPGRIQARSPPDREGIVARTALVDRLVAARQPSVLAVVAPAGYGKTTLLAQWAERKQPRVVWLSADDRDNDPTVLLTHLAVAVDRVERIDPRVFRSLASPGAGMAGVARVGRVDRVDAAPRSPSSSIMPMRSPTVAVAISSPSWRCDSPPVRSWRSDLGGRCRCPCRSSGPGAASSEIGVDDLAMSGPEARSLLVGAGVELADDRAGRARRPHRGMAGGPVPRGTGDQRRISRGAQLQVHGGRSLRRRLPPIGVPPPCLACGRVVPHPHVDPRAHVRAAVRCHRWVARDPAGCSIGWSAATCWCSRWIAAASGTATTTSSASCCTPS